MLRRRRALSGKSRNAQSLHELNRRHFSFEPLETRSLLAAQFIINEFLAANGSGLRDGFNELSDWIEIRNVGDASGDLAGYHLTDEPNDLDKWTFPAGTVVASNAHLIVFASGRNTIDAQGRRHTNFSLNIDEDYLALTSPANVVLSEFGPDGTNYPQQRPNLSYGLNGTTAVYMAIPTPGALNAAGVTQLVGDTTFSVDRGFYSAPFEVNISTNTPGATIRYTTDGSVPSPTNGVTYFGPITINRTTTLRAMAFKSGMVSSNVDTQTYIFLDDVLTQSFQSTIDAGLPTAWGTTAPDYGMDTKVIGPNDLFGGVYAASIKNDLKAIPTVSIVMNVQDMFGSNGIYTNPTSSGPSWERATSVEYILPDGSEGFQLNSGIQIQGGAFRNHSLTKKKSFRVNFKELYGASNLEYPLFGEQAVDEFDNFILRAENNDGWQWSSAGGRPLYSRDEWAARTQQEMGQPAVHGHHVHVYINGFYWGMYNLVERPDDAFSASYFGGEKEEWDAINAGEAIEGDLTAWNTMISLATTVRNAVDEPTRVAAWQRLQGNNPDGSDNPNFEDYLDVDSLIDYMIVNIYAGNNDWPSHNYYVGRRRGQASTGFKFYSWDAEWVLGLNSDVNADRTGVNINVAAPYDILKTVPEFKIKFADHVHKHFFNGGALYVDPSNPNWDPAHPERNRPAARFIELTDEIKDAIVGESARWGDQHQATPHHRAEWEAERTRILTTYFPQRSAIVLNQLRAAGLYPNVDAPAFNQHGGQIPADFDLRMNASSGTVYYTLDGSDPRLPNGAISPAAIAYPAVNTTTTLIAKNSVWNYLDNGSNQGTAWRVPPQVDPWASGPGQLGYGEGDEARPIARGPAPGGGDFITTYFRRKFTVTDAASISSLRINLVRDDGAVVYINGQPATRSNMPDDPINYLTPPLGSMGAPSENAYHLLPIDPAMLHDGENTIAVELHQIASGNSDASFDLEMIAFSTSGAPPITLNASTEVKARVLDGTTWSALNEAFFSLHTPASAANLKISEINYNPTEPTAGEPNIDNDEFEYIELVNVGAGTIDLRGVRFTGGLGFDFTNGSATTLAAGERTLLVKNLTAFAARYPGDYNIAGTFTGSLDNSGEGLTLVDANDAFIANFTYNDSGAWPERPDGDGATLVLISTLVDPNNPDNWRSSTEFGGSPGAVGLPPIDSVIVNEVLTHTDPPLVDAVELYNPTGAAIDLSGWYLSDGGQPDGVTDGLAQYKKFRIPDGTILQPGAYLVIDEDDFNPTPQSPLSHHFSFNSAEGDDVWLISADASGNLLNFIDHVGFGAAANGESFGRWPNVTGDLYPMTSRTFGAANSGPRIGPVIISELMYHPLSNNDDLEFIELSNVTDSAVDLSGWKFDAGVDFTFPAGTSIAPSGMLLVLRFDPNNPANAAKLTAFQAAYPNLPGGAQLVGGYAAVLDGGVLSDGGETLRLSRPDMMQPGGLIPYILVDEVDYDDVDPWPMSPDGTGSSLTRTSQTIYGNEPSNWTGATATPGVPQFGTITGTDGNDTYHVIRFGSQLRIYENIPPEGVPTYAIELSALGPSLTINALGGDDVLIVNSGGQPALGVGRLVFNAGSGANSLVLVQGAARIDSTATGGTLNSTVQAGAQLTTSRLNQNGLTVSGNGRVTLLAGGQTNVLTTLDLSPTGTLDLADNDLVIQSTAANKPALLSVVSGWLDAGFADGLWNGPGIISSTAATNPIGDTGLSLVDNGLLGLAQFGGVTVDENALVLKYTYYGDIDLNGQVDGEDLTVFALNFGRTTGATQVDGDIDFNGRVDGEDLTVFANNFGKGIGAPLAAAPKDELRITNYEGSAAAAAEGVVPAGSVAPAGRPGLAAAPSNANAGSLASEPASGAIAGSSELAMPSSSSSAPADDALVNLLAESIAAQADSLADARLATSRKNSAADALWAEAQW